jgi:uncharacterized protein (TIGR02246 family)
MHAPNRFVATLLACGVVLAAGAAVAKEHAMSANACFVPAFKSANADAVAACYADDAIIWFPGGPMAKGRPAIRDGFAGFFAKTSVKDVTLTEIGQASMGNTRTTWGTYAISLVDNATNAASVENGRYVDVQKKIHGHWLYIVDHPSDDPAPVAK